MWKTAQLDSKTYFSEAWYWHFSNNARNTNISEYQKIKYFLRRDNEFANHGTASCGFSSCWTWFVAVLQYEYLYKHSFCHQDVETLLGQAGLTVDNLLTQFGGAPSTRQQQDPEALLCKIGIVVDNLLAQAGMAVYDLLEQRSREPLERQQEDYEALLGQVRMTVDDLVA